MNEHLIDQLSQRVDADAKTLVEIKKDVVAALGRAQEAVVQARLMRQQHAARLARLDAKRASRRERASQEEQD